MAAEQELPVVIFLPWRGARMQENPVLDADSRTSQAVGGTIRRAFVCIGVDQSYFGRVYQFRLLGDILLASPGIDWFAGPDWKKLQGKACPRDSKALSLL